VHRARMNRIPGEDFTEDIREDIMAEPSEVDRREGGRAVTRPLPRWLEEWWPTASVLVGGVGGGGLFAAVLIFWVAPEGHWMRESWISVGLLFIGVWTLMWTGFARFTMWIVGRMSRIS